jgi:prevent-host-death family protein
MSRVIKASEFKAKCLAVLDEVGRTRQAVVITKRGKPVAELVPHTAPKRNARGILKGRLEIVGDIKSKLRNSRRNASPFSTKSSGHDFADRCRVGSA